ncbi:MAG TPA: iron-siderophore ABC transporter substrate-binding protein [Actinomycetales bacterium]|jgi:iron complex transport system substrate-binding protein
MRSRTLALLTALSLSLAACGGADVEPENSAAAPSQTRTVEHFRGTTQVPANPQRVVVLDLGELDSAVALGVRPVGAVRASVKSGLLSYLEDDLAGVELVGEIGEPNLEQIAALEPDLILGSERRVAEFYDELSAIAPTVFSEDVGGAWKENFALHAEALGKQKEGAALMSAYEQRSEQVGAALPDDTTLSVVRFNPGEIRLYARAGFVGTVLADAGIARPANQDVDEVHVKVSAEQIGQAAGDVIVYSSYGDRAETDGPAVLAGPLWKKLPAVATGQVHEVSDDVWFLGTGVGAAQLVLDELEDLLV